MPSGYVSTVPSDVVWDEGVMYINSSTAFGVSKGPWRYDPAERWQNLEFAGKRSPVAGLDRVVERMPSVTGTLIAISTTTSPVIFAGSSQAGTNPTTITPIAASGLLASGSLQSTVRFAWKKGNGDYFIVKFAKALMRLTAISGADKDAVEFEMSIEARLDPATMTTTDDSPVVYQITNAL